MAGFDVKLPKTEQPKFPPICIGCGGPPTTTFKIKADAVGWWSAVRFGWLIGIMGGRAFDVPACDPCFARLTRQRRLRTLGEYAFIGLGLVLSIWLLEDWDGLKGKLAMFGVVAVAMLPWILYERFFPPTVDITVTDGAVTFHFAERDYAQKFANENRSL
jgi:hypothetical protein